MNAACRHQADQRIDVTKLTDGPVAVAADNDRRARDGADPAMLLGGSDQAFRFCLARLVAIGETLPDIEFVFRNRSTALAADIGRAQVQQRDRRLRPLESRIFANSTA